MPAKIARKSRAHKSRAHKKAFRIPMAPMAVKKSARRHRRRGGARKGKKAAKARSSMRLVMKAVGSKAEVYKGKAMHTAGGLRKKQIKRVKVGKRNGKKIYRYVSAKKHAAGKKLRARMMSKGFGNAARLWRAALKAVTGGKIPRKGTSEYRLAKAYYRRLLARGGVQTTPPLRRVMSRTKTAKRSRRRTA